MATPFRFGPGNCCCPVGDCTPDGDDFNRPDSSDLGSALHEEVGNWEILDEELHERAGGGGTSDAQVFFTRPVQRAGEMFIAIKIIGAATGDIFRIYPCCVTYHAPGPVVATFEVRGDGDWNVTIGSVTTVMSPVPAYGGVWAYVCADAKNKMCKAFISSTGDARAEPAWDDLCDPGPGKYCGLGHDNATTGATFDDFTVTDLRLRDGTVCYACFCECDTAGALHKHLTLVGRGCTNRAVCWNGQHVHLVYQWNAGFPRWYGSDGTGDLAGRAFWILCDPNGHNFELWSDNVLCFIGTGAGLAAAAGSGCDPFTMIYTGTIGWLSCAACGYAIGDPLSGPDQAGDWTFVVTDDDG